MNATVHLVLGAVASELPVGLVPTVRGVGGRVVNYNVPIVRDIRMRR